MNDEREIQKARAHLTVVAAGLATKFGALDAGAVLLGAAVGALLTEFGDDRTAEYLRGVADAIENGEDEPVSRLN